MERRAESRGHRVKAEEHGAESMGHGAKGIG